jgi:hypothetical protein
MGRTAGLIAAVLAALGSDALAQPRCDMALAVRHGDPAATAILASTSGEEALFFSADLDVNTDGAARSYHPDDPRGRTLALNNMGNAITRIFDAEGHDITCSPRRGACFGTFMETFDAARDAGYDPRGHPRFETTGIIPWRLDPALGREVPCTIASGPFAGYFVSQTALLADASADVCDQARYLDALAINAIVLPRGAAWRSQGTMTDGGDLAALLDAETGLLAFALVGDRGPADAIGEGSVALAAALGGVTVADDATFAEIKALKRPRVATLIFPTRDVPRLTGRRFTQADIDRLGTEALAAFGGRERLEACALAGPP